jgi:hypothetical protein
VRGGDALAMISGLGRVAGPQGSDGSGAQGEDAMVAAVQSSETSTARSDWAEDLTPIDASDWTRDQARHLLDRAGFGGTPAEIDRLAAMTPEAAVRSLVDYRSIPCDQLRPFEESDVYDPSLHPFPETRPAATRLAERTGAAMGVEVKPTGDLRLQPVVNRFFFWLRATAMETRRLANWWAERMLLTPRPLEEKMALFWHGHFATAAEKVRDYRKMQTQLALFHRHATGNFRDLLIGVAQDPAMLVFLDAGRNVKGAPNENFGREVMELFTMGVGHYTEQDIREAARAFTGWIDDDLTFKVDPSRHDDGMKTVLGQTGPFDGVAVLEIILRQEATARHVAGRLYRFLVRDDLSPALQKRLGAMLAGGNFEIEPFLTTIFLSRDFYSPASVGTRIKGPVELIVSTYRRLGLKELPGVPDFNSVSGELGQVLLDPPTVAGWAQGRAWITPGTLLARGNFAREVMFPDMIDFTDPNIDPGLQIRNVNAKVLKGMSVAAATAEGPPMPSGTMMVSGEKMGAAVAVAAFNTRYASLKGWQEAARKVRPILRRPAQFSLTEIVTTGGCATAQEAVDLLCARLLSVPIDGDVRATLVEFLEDQLGTADIGRARTYMEEPLRLVGHLVMSTPEYQLA